VLCPKDSLREEIRVREDLRGRAIRKDNQAGPRWLLRRVEERQQRGEGTSEEGLAPKDFKHVRPALEHLVALEMLERERKPGRKAKWLYRKTDKLGEKVMSIEGE
jgi:hypothetical protein